MHRIFIVLALGLSIAHGARAAEIRVITDTWQPYAGATMLNGGFSLDLLGGILRKLGHTMTVKYVNWDELEAVYPTSTYDVIVNIWYTKEREQWVRYTQPFANSELVFVSRIEQGFQFNALSALQGKSLALVKGYAYPPTVMSAPNIDIHFVADVESILQKVVQGLVHVGLGDKQVLRFTAGQTIPRQHRLFYDVEHPLISKALYFAVNRQYSHESQLVQEINLTLLQFQQDGTLEKLKAKHGMH